PCRDEAAAAGHDRDRRRHQVKLSAHLFVLIAFCLVVRPFYRSRPQLTGRATNQDLGRLFLAIPIYIRATGEEELPANSERFQRQICPLIHVRDWSSSTCWSRCPTDRWSCWCSPSSTRQTDLWWSSCSAWSSRRRR